MALKLNPKEIPESVLACVWFANPDKLEWETQKTVVITSVLNRGQWEAVQWIYRTYGEAAIKSVVAHPGRGQWFPQSLRFWLTFFSISLDSQTFQKALLHL
ncbi:MAG: hypothetical protein A3I05_10035 [Deltaproteobacteria bacterium RIFCSPLOWO2_02_FULL_44_10]|nr:MAG: hypothetical protein A3C46_09150 [Deltaproteobacteria bacterium RIFCSPHIGHO2_02_FULL_44_16]OGQ45028.1 MAG: hypothetical protein A3I05_10035 [Deltaproteobacteria bacterium RIFCSPLOWO2_02_FULL_44_10]